MDDCVAVINIKFFYLIRPPYVVSVNGLEVVAHRNFYPAVRVCKLFATISLILIAQFALHVVADDKKA